MIFEVFNRKYFVCKVTLMCKRWKVTHRWPWAVDLSWSERGRRGVGSCRYSCRERRPWRNVWTDLRYQWQTPPSPQNWPQIENPRVPARETVECRARLVGGVELTSRRRGPNTLCPISAGLLEETSPCCTASPAWASCCLIRRICSHTKQNTWCHHLIESKDSPPLLRLSLLK